MVGRDRDAVTGAMRTFGHAFLGKFVARGIVEKLPFPGVHEDFPPRTLLASVDSASRCLARVTSLGITWLIAASPPFAGNGLPDDL
jgi:hypothetical protein